jgi:heterogeneous nuclear ribonucleoprotein A1/A3
MRPAILGAALLAITLVGSATPAAQAQTPGYGTPYGYSPYGGYPAAPYGYGAPGGLPSPYGMDPTLAAYAAMGYGGYGMSPYSSYGMSPYGAYGMSPYGYGGYGSPYGYPGMGYGSPYMGYGMPTMGYGSPYGAYGMPTMGYGASPYGGAGSAQVSYPYGGYSSTTSSGSGNYLCTNTATGQQQVIPAASVNTGFTACTAY